MINRSIHSIIVVVSLVISLFSGENGNAQNPVETPKPPLDRTGQFTFSWGYNRAQYSASDIRVYGPGYDFTLHKVLSTDRAENFSLKSYFSIERIAIPQFNIRFGYYLRDNISVTFGWDHMKYVVRQWQEVGITGYIDPSVSATYAGTYSNDPIMIKHSFFDYEHTNGLNYQSVEIDFMYPVYKSKNNMFRVNLEGGGGLALIIPRSDVFLFGFHGANVFHLAGYGFHANGGLRFDFGKHFFFRANVKGGFIDLPSVLTFKEPGYKAKQHFWFLQEYGTLGYALSFKKKNR